MLSAVILKNATSFIGEGALSRKFKYLRVQLTDVTAWSYGEMD